MHSIDRLIIDISTEKRPIFTFSIRQYSSKQWGIRKLTHGRHICDRWAIDLWSFSFIFEFWFLTNKGL